jgi:coronin-1B/1C/6
VFAEEDKKELHYTDIQLSTKTGDHNYISGNSKFFCTAVRGGGGPVIVVPYEKVGKVARDFPTVAGHSASVTDTAWNPFNDNLLATGSDDCTVKIWEIPDGGITEKLTTPVADLTGAGKAVSLLNFHPTANNVLAAASKEPAVRIWDVEKQEAKLTVEIFGGLVQSMDWSANGAELLTASKDKKARIFDPRTSAATLEIEPHEGAKPFKAIWLHGKDQFLTAGFTRTSTRQLKTWDARKVGEPVYEVTIDQSAGVLMPFYDPDTSMLYVAGKGDGNIRYFELTDSEAFKLDEFRSQVGCRGTCVLPKRRNDVTRCEVMRFLKLTTTNSVEGVSFCVPRKEEIFHADIFPDTYAGKPSIDADKYFGGENGEPKTISMDPAKNGGMTASSAASFKVVAKAPAPAPSPAPAAGGGGGGDDAAADSVDELKKLGVDELAKQLAAARIRIRELESKA